MAIRGVHARCFYDWRFGPILGRMTEWQQTEDLTAVPAKGRLLGEGSSGQRSVGGVRQMLLRGLRRTADLLLPPRCLSCSAPLWGETQVCGSCWTKLQFIDAPLCNLSGIPFPFDAGPGALSAEALARPVAYSRARAALVYEKSSGRLVSRLKYGDRLEAVPLFARWMARAGAVLLADADIIVPVPLHATRLFQRRFNQSAELARAVARLSGVPAVPDLLIRTRATRAQVGLSASARRRNVAGVFALTPGKGEKVRGKRVLLIDDVVTTGATVEACSRTLIAEGAAAVDVLTFARVVPGEGTPI